MLSSMQSNPYMGTYDMFCYCLTQMYVSSSGNIVSRFLDLLLMVLGTDCGVEVRAVMIDS